MGGNSIFNMMSKVSNNTNTTNDMMGLLNGRFGNINNAMRYLQGMLNNRGLNAEQLVRKNIQGKHFSDETINQFREFAKQSGMSESDIDKALRSIGVIK